MPGISDTRSSDTWNNDTHTEHVPTHIDGITHTGGNTYQVAFTLFLEADSPEQASERAMAVRNSLWTVKDVARPDGTSTLEPLEADFYWHLHDHDGC